MRGTAHRSRTEHEVEAVQDGADPLVPTVDVPTEEWVVVEAREITGRRFARAEP